MSQSTARMAIAASRSVAKGSVFGARSASQRGAPLPGRGAGNQKKLGAGALVLSARLGLGMGSAWYGVPRRLAGSRGVSSGGGGSSEFPAPAEGAQRMNQQESQDKVAQWKKDQANLFNAILQSSTAAKLLKLVQEKGASFTAGHTTVAWGAAAEMPSGGGAGDEGVVIELLQVQTLVKVVKMGGREIANSAHA